jgi:hypothetical protein
LIDKTTITYTFLRRQSEWSQTFALLPLRRGIGQTEVVELLLARGGGVEIKDKYSETALIQKTTLNKSLLDMLMATFSVDQHLKVIQLVQAMKTRHREGFISQHKQFLERVS